MKKKSSLLVAGFCVLTIIVVTVCLTFTLTSSNQHKDTHVLLEEQKWIHGAENCDTQSDPLIQIVQYNFNTWIFRQNKCIHPEAPFIYLFMGENKALLVDTGATESETMFPLYDVVSNLLKENDENKIPLPLIVAHTHSHSDHYAGDNQFHGKTSVSVVGLEVENVKNFFDISQWPEGVVNLDLGERLIQIFAIPGHQDASIAFYDNTSKLLITGDTFYPGRLYVYDWILFKQSIGKLYDFATHHEISYIVGTHIEMSLTNGIDYPVGSTYQPEEQILPLSIEDLGSLNEALHQTSNTPERIVFDKFIVSPR